MALRPIDLKLPAEASGPAKHSLTADRLARLPDSHPSSQRYTPDRADVRPLTDAEHAEHVADVATRLSDARAERLDTRFLHTIDDQHEIWTDKRDAAHDALVMDLYRRCAGVPCEHRAIVAGGLPGAGKTTVLGHDAGLDPSRYLLLNPDVIKYELARREMLPQIAGLAPMEASSLAHEEASHIAKRLAHCAQADGKNVIWDVTMSRAETCVRRLGALREAGYAHVDALFVHIPIEVSLQRADARHRQGHDDYRAGIGLGGRFAPPEMILAQYDAEWGSVNRANFEQVRQRFTAWAVYDNSVNGRPARLIDYGSEDTGSGRKVFE